MKTLAIVMGTMGAVLAWGGMTAVAADADAASQAACAHAHVRAVEAKNPTCADWGWYACQACDDCGRHLQAKGPYSPMRPPIHAYYDAGVEQPKGVTTYTCTGCGKTLVSDVRAAKKIPLASGDKIIFFGDSLTYFGWRKGGYCQLTRDLLASRGIAVDVEAFGVIGNTSADALARLQREKSRILKKGATGRTYFTNLLGVNDVSPFHAGHPTVEQYLSNVKATLGLVRNAGIQPVVIVFPGTVCDNATSPAAAAKSNYSEQLPLVTALRNYAVAEGFPIVEAFDPFHETVRKQGPQSVTADGIHLNDAGNRLLAELIVAASGPRAE